MAKRYGYKGTNDEQHTCEVCGKVELKKVMWLVELNEDGEEVGEPFATGTTCGAKLLGYNQKDFNKAIKNAQSKIERKKQFAYNNHPLYKQAIEIRKTAKRGSEEFNQSKEMMRQAMREVSQQKFNIEI